VDIRSTVLFDNIVNLLVPLMDTTRERQAALYPIIHAKPVSKKIEWEGSPEQFTVRLVRLLSKDQLLALLRRLTVGADQRAEIVNVCARIEQVPEVFSGRLVDRDDVELSATIHAGRGATAPIAVLSTVDLPGMIPNFPQIRIPYVSRAKTQQYYHDLIRLKRIMILGRTGLGKTREAIELVQRFESELGEALTVLMVQQYGPIADFDLPHTISSRNVLLFLDDCHLLARRYLTFAHSSGTQISFSLWISKVLAQLHAASTGRLWVVATMRDEPGLADQIDLAAAPWTTFAAHKVEPLSPDLTPDALRAVSDAFQTPVKAEAVSQFVDRCDGTFMSLIAYFQKKSHLGIEVITEDEARDFVGSYPVLWRTDYYTFIEPNPTFRAIFTSLSLLRRVGVFPFEDVVFQVSAHFDSSASTASLTSALKAFETWVTREAVSFSAKQIVYVLRCPDAYLQDLVDLSAEHLRKVFARALLEIYYGTPLLDRGLSPLIPQIYQALRLFPQEVTPLLIEQVSSLSLLGDLPSAALLLAEYRSFDAVPSLIARLNTLKAKQPKTALAQASFMGVRQEIAICLGYIAHPLALDVIFETIADTADGTIMGDLIENLPMFQNRKSLELILNEVALWSEFRRGLLSEFCLKWPLLATSVTEEEQQERDKLGGLRSGSSVNGPGLRSAIESAIASDLSRVRFRGYLSASLFTKLPIELLQNGLTDQAAVVRGACLMMLSRRIGIRDMAEIIESFREDLGMYDGVTVKAIADDLLARMSSGSLIQFNVVAPHDYGEADDPNVRNLVPPHLVHHPMPKVNDLPTDPTEEWLALHGEAQGVRTLLGALISERETLRLAASIALAELRLATTRVVDNLYAYLDKKSYNVLISSECAKGLAALAQHEPVVAESLVTALDITNSSISLLEALSFFPNTDQRIISFLEAELDRLLDDGSWWLLNLVVTALRAAGNNLAAKEERVVRLLPRLADRDAIERDHLISAVIAFGVDRNLVDEVLRSVLQFRMSGSRRGIVRGSYRNSCALRSVGQLGLRSDWWMDRLNDGLRNGYFQASCLAIAELGQRDERFIRPLRRIVTMGVQTKPPHDLRDFGFSDPRLLAAIALASIEASDETSLKVIASGPDEFLASNTASILRNAIQRDTSSHNMLTAFIIEAAPNRRNPSLGADLLTRLARTDNSNAIINHLVSLVENERVPRERVAAVKALHSLGFGTAALENLLQPWLLSKDLPRQFEAARVLVELGSTSPRALAVITSALTAEDETMRTRSAAAQALARRAVTSDASTDFLCGQFLTETDEVVAVFLAKALLRI
jgi:hypothetical protein